MGNQDLPQDPLGALLSDRVPWEQGEVSMFGKKIPEPRLTCYFGDLAYKYSGRFLEAKSFQDGPEIVAQLRTQVESYLALNLRKDASSASTTVNEPISFNSVLMNRYRSGDDSQGWHSDDEAVYGRNPQIASLSFGATRDFCFRVKPKAPVSFGPPAWSSTSSTVYESAKITLPLHHGSLLFMGGPIQHFWQHSLPRRKAVSSERVNLTFRL